MDSLKIISDINDHLTTLDAKVEKTSKSASLAFSYLYGKIEQVDDCVNTFKQLDEKVTYVVSDIEKTNIYSYSYFTSLKANITDIKLANSNDVISLNDTIGSLNKKINEIETKMQLIDEKLDKIIDCPEKFIVVKQEPPILIMFFRKIYNLFYRIFHAKQIRETNEALIEKERKRKEEEEERKHQEELERKRKIELEKKEKQNKIKDLLRK